ncbi:transcription initiation factor TFIID subunit 3-like isoform X2 [Microplitis mediator]|uniref:transcription initiation factor TFIID subunit 3-like isoform X2 n=1 Tax=Microplitis mediator TaxID=375433 RepID=UPI0025525224|nr:transcription initiation factor TFIID subunit 3-like isoform X2 [Microplitis mediator]
MAEYLRGVLQVIVGQICQSIGWRSVHSSPLEFMVDLLHEYLRQLAHISNEYAEVLGRTDVNLDDVGLAFQHMNIDLNQLAEYVENFESIPCAIQIPKYPVLREDHLNFMKPGSHEVIKRPMHVPEYLPPMYPNLEELSAVEEKKIIFKNDENINLNQNINPSIGLSVQNQMSTVINNQILGVIKRPGDPLFNSFGPDKRIKMSDETKKLREIQSVMMTPSGFLSPAREDTPGFSGNNDVELIRLPTPCYIYSQDDMTPPSTPEIPKTPEIKISKVESLASVSQEQSLFNDFGIAPTMHFSMYPVSPTDGPGLIPYVINSPSITSLPLPSIQSDMKSINANIIYDSSSKEVKTGKRQSYITKSLLPSYSKVGNAIELSSISRLENQYSPTMSPKKLDKSSKKHKNDTKDKSLTKTDMKEKNCVEISTEKKKNNNNNNKKMKKIKIEDNGVKVTFALDSPASKPTTIKKSRSKIDEKKEELKTINSVRSHFQLKFDSTASKHMTPKNSVKKTAVKIKNKNNGNKNNIFSSQFKGLKVNPNEIKPLITENQFVEKIILKPLPKKVDEVKTESSLLEPFASAYKPVKEKIKKVKSDDCMKKSLKGNKSIRKRVKETVPVISPTIVGPDGQQIWICPACGREDNGTPMIGCDDCDAWYHWICIGMHVPPPHDVNWYCKRCITKRLKSISNHKNQRKV